MDSLVQLWESTESFKFEYGVTPFSDWKYPIYGVSAYILVVFFGPLLMKNRKPIKPRLFAIVHNLFLSILSVAMVSGVVYEMIRIYFIEYRYGPHPSSFMCDPDKLTAEGRMNFWTYVFYLSKYYEFIDTFIHILAKHKVIFLHWYHHVVTLVLVWMGLCDRNSMQWMAVFTNASVHIVMYFYYALTSAGYRPSWKKFVTQIQIYQFIIDLLVPQTWIILKLSGYECSGTVELFVFGETIILSFLILFIKFYKEAYAKQSHSAPNTKNTKNNKKSD